MKYQTKTISGENISIIREPIDQIALRVSMGGKKGIGYYLVFRGGDMNEIEDLLSEGLEAFKRAKNDLIKQSN